MFDDVLNKIELLCILGDKKHCFQTVKTLRIATTTTSTSLVVMATSTDGYLSIWDITEMLAEFKEERRRDENNKNNNHSNDQGDVKKMVSSTPNHHYNNNHQHVNRNRHKFHELEVPLFNTSSTTATTSGDQMLCFHHKIHQSGINSLDVVLMNPNDLLESDSGINCLIEFQFIVLYLYGKLTD